MSTGGPPIPYPDILEKYAVARCEAGGCKCELAIDNGTIVSSRFLEFNETLRTQVSNVQHSTSEQELVSPLTLGHLQQPIPSTDATQGLPSSVTVQPSRDFQHKPLQQAADFSRKREEEARLATAVSKAEEDERTRQQAVIRQREAETAAVREELARVKEQLTQAQQRLQAEKSEPTSLPLNRRKALVIGNDAYTRVSRLEAARADAGAVGRTLTTLGFQVWTYTDLAERPLKQALRDFKSLVQPGDEVMFFFAGHGVQIAGTNFLLPTDIQGESEDQVRDEGVQLQRVLDDMQERGARFSLAVIDACRDNPFRQAGRAIGGRGLAPTAAASGQMIIFSAGAGQQALDRLGQNDKDPNGVFTRVFVKEMVKPDVPVDRVLRAVRNEVVQMARSVGKDQTPALYDQAVGDFFFKKKSP